MQKQWSLCWGLALCIKITLPVVLFGMNPDETPTKDIFNQIRSLPQELQKEILLAQHPELLAKTINFLGLQPITLAQPTNQKVSVALYGDIIETKSKSSLDIKWNTTLWNARTSKHILTITSPCKPWEKDGHSVISVDKAINIMCYYCDVEVVRSNTTGLWDINTGELLNQVEYEDNVLLLATDNNRITIGFSNSKILVRPIEDEKNKPMIMFEYSGEKISSLALCNNIVIIGSKLGCTEIWDTNTGEQLNWCNEDEHIDCVTAITTHNNKVFFGLWNGTIKIWDMDAKTVEKTLSANEHSLPIKSITTDGKILVTGSKNGMVKVWPLEVNAQGKTDDNPLVWIIYCIDLTQLDFIKRACYATENGKELVIDLPKKLGVIENDESPEQIDGRIYFTLPEHIREYLRNRLKIRRPSKTPTEDTSNNNCAIM